MMRKRNKKSTVIFSLSKTLTDIQLKRWWQCMKNKRYNPGNKFDTSKMFNAFPEYFEWFKNQ